MDIPRLLIIAEHDICSSTEQWVSILREIADHLPEFPHALLQIRAKTEPHKRALAQKELTSNLQIAMNCSSTEASLFSEYLLHHPQNDMGSEHTYPFGMSIHAPTDPVKFDKFHPLYYQIGPIFRPLSKIGIAQGLGLLSQTKQYTTTPLIAVGGITPSSIPELLKAGAHGIASSGYIVQAKNPIRALRTLYECVMCHFTE